MLQYRELGRDGGKVRSYGFTRDLAEPRHIQGLKRARLIVDLFLGLLYTNAERKAPRSCTRKSLRLLEETAYTCRVSRT